MRLLIIVFFLFSFFLVQSTPSYAIYVLPYPSVMPEGIAYKLHLALEAAQRFWYFGDFGQFTYNLKESDKYLVEAKTLFDYDQYLLGYNALQKSDEYFSKTLPLLLHARKNHKNIQEFRALLTNASQKHIEVLSFLEKNIPHSVIWRPEKSGAVFLPLQNEINHAIHVRVLFL